MSKKFSSIILKAIPFVIAIGVSAGGFLFTQINKKKEKELKEKEKENSLNSTAKPEPYENKINE